MDPLLNYLDYDIIINRDGTKLIFVLNYLAPLKVLEVVFEHGSGCVTGLHTASLHVLGDPWWSTAEHTDLLDLFK